MKIVGIIGAMPSELVDIRKKLADPKIEKYSGFEFYINQIEDKKVINVCSGITKVNAAICTQVLIDRFNPDSIINAGIAGGMNSEVKVCDIVVSQEVIAHDVDLHFLVDYPPYCGIYKANEELINITVKTCDYFGIKSHVGRIVSGESFISSNEVKSEIVSRLSPYAVDMESSAIGHCAFLNDIPFVSVRCISDNADDEGAMSFDEFEKIAAKKVADIVLKMITY